MVGSTEVVMAIIALPGAVGLGWVATAMWLVHRGRRPVAPEGPTWDAIVVAGCRVRGDGTASTELARRTRHAADLYHRGLAPRIVLSGGVPVGGVTEARAAWVVARDHGVPEEALVIEEQSASTLENARNSRGITGDVPVLVVTSDYHVVRCEHLFRRHYSRVRATGAPGRPLSSLRWGLREVASMVFHAAMGR